MPGTVAQDEEVTVATLRQRARAPPTAQTLFLDAGDELRAAILPFVTQQIEKGACIARPRREASCVEAY